MARFYRRGCSKIYFATSISDSTHPSSGELNSATDLSSSLASIVGFGLNQQTTTLNPLTSSFGGTVPAQTSVQPSSLTLYDDDASSTIRSLFVPNTFRYVILCPYGRGTGKRCETWKVVPVGVSDIWDMGNVSARYSVIFAVPINPILNAVLPS